MAENSRARSSAPRVAAFAAALSVVVMSGALSPVAGADPSTKERLEAAEAEFKQIAARIESQQDVLDRLSAEAAVLAQQFQEAESRWEQITDELRRTRAELEAARSEFATLRSRLDERAREAYMEGPGNAVEFLLGATSLSDLSDRVEFVNALSQTDADLANEVQNLRNDLAAQEDEQQKLQARAAKALRQVEANQAALDAKFAEQQSILDQLSADRARAAELVKDLKKKYRKELAALSGVRFYADGVFKVCPVDQPRAVYDGFGAPRFGGGYHPHAGNDIMAPQGTPIRATFDGVARTSTNSLGGYAVYVYGSLGYTYNAHLMQPGVTGSVSAGDIIGYVGTTGNASTPHNHFEWHPNAIPADWPASPYGYKVIGSALNPYPILSQVC
jgi:murein DD-endopeptidase MepM/ murein hydrolase activator NlpD